MDSEFERAIVAFNRGRYFEAAAGFERAARSGGDNDAEARTLCGALARVAAALHLRFERGGRQGTVNLISQALAELDDLRPSRIGLDLERLCVELAAFVDAIRTSPREERERMRYRARLFVERRRAPRIVKAPPIGSRRG